ncbi:hypothetical protein Bca52824_091805 [Brassica carinata]|uniref:AB hydrolase-1 domain-containing protein n=1 Tax=Brassica carinata TaxID=52824 RepID=A0A8X7NSP5_BRACI|nr:hypothetical protein Bca52824_091805 [Brassica carinata]
MDVACFCYWPASKKTIKNRRARESSKLEEAHNVKVIGSGNQGTIVLGHGFGTDQSVWKHLVPHLVEDYRLVLYDNMGAGTTNPEYFDFDRYSTLEGFSFDLIAILEDLQIESCIFVGHSLSGMVGVLASLNRPDLFFKIVMISASPRYIYIYIYIFYYYISFLFVNLNDFLGVILVMRFRYVNDADYQGGFEEEDLNQLFEAMRSNYKAWCLGFAPLAVGGDLDSVAVQEFSRTLFNMRPDIALSLAQTIFHSDMRQILPFVSVPCHIVQSVKDLAVPVAVTTRNRGDTGRTNSSKCRISIFWRNSGEMVVGIISSNLNIREFRQTRATFANQRNHILTNFRRKSDNIFETSSSEAKIPTNRVA